MKVGLLLFSLIAVALTFAPTVQASASSAKVDATAVVYKVIDGDTFDAFPVGRVRLADVNAPEVGEPGYYEAKDFLSSLIYGRRVYLDVDDLYVMDKYNRLVCVVYVRYNSTHLLNVNEALLLEGLAVISD
jgi:micrococcal nuclease